MTNTSPCKECLQTAGFITLMVIVGAIAIPLAPIVSLVALPIFACKACPKAIAHRKQYQLTLLTNNTRAKFGRIEGQDYTRWDGKVTQLTPDDISAAQRQIHEDLGLYFHGDARCQGSFTWPAIKGSTTRSPEDEAAFKQAYEAWEEKIKAALVPPDDCPFQTVEDLKWLEKEFIRKEAEELLNTDFKMIRAFAKALIPLLGLIWILFTETMPGGASEMGCSVCNRSGSSSYKHWSWRNAIYIHANALAEKLQLPKSEIIHPDYE